MLSGGLSLALWAVFRQPCQTGGCHCPAKGQPGASWRDTRLSVQPPWPFLFGDKWHSMALSWETAFHPHPMLPSIVAVRFHSREDTLPTCNKNCGREEALSGSPARLELLSSTTKRRVISMDAFQKTLFKNLQGGNAQVSCCCCAHRASGAVSSGRLTSH